MIAASLATHRHLGGIVLKVIVLLPDLLDVVKRNLHRTLVRLA